MRRHTANDAMAAIFHGLNICAPSAAATQLCNFVHSIPALALLARGYCCSGPAGLRRTHHAAPRGAWVSCKVHAATSSFFSKFVVGFAFGLGFTGSIALLVASSISRAHEEHRCDDHGGPDFAHQPIRFQFERAGHHGELSRRAEARGGFACPRRAPACLPQSGRFSATSCAPFRYTPAFHRGSLRRSVSTGAQLPSVLSGFHSPATAFAGGARWAPPSATKPLHHRQQHEAFAERAPVLLRQSRAREDVSVANAPSREERLAVGERAIDMRRARVIARGICRCCTASRASGSGVPASVRESGPSRSSHAVTRNESLPLFSISPHESPAGPAPPTCRRAAMHEQHAAIVHKLLDRLRLRLGRRSALPHDERRVLPARARCASGRKRLRSAIVRVGSGAAAKRKIFAVAGRSPITVTCAADSAGDGQNTRCCPAVLSSAGSSSLSPAAARFELRHVELHRLPLRRAR